MESQSRALPTTIRSPPALEDYKPLSEHQSQTPETFFGGKPILHYHAIGARAYIPKSQRRRLPFFPADAPQSTTPAPELADGAQELVDRDVDLFVNSEAFTIFSREGECGISIPYPVIAIHAIKSFQSGDDKAQSVYMQLDFGDDGGGSDDDESFGTVELTIVPPASSTPLSMPATESQGTSQSEASKLFDAISACADLHPDPAEDEDEDGDYNDRIIFESTVDPDVVEGFTSVYRGAADGGLPPPLPGSSGWITAENVHEYFDEEGNWTGQDSEGVGGELGEGAGHVRGRNEAESAEVNGHGTDDDAENKRARTE